MDGVYIIERNNGESYEDFYWWVDGVFDSEEKAINYLKKQGFKKDQNGWSVRMRRNEYYPDDMNYASVVHYPMNKGVV